ncbi:two-component system response regulator TcrA [Amnibacterium kyonggiense]
MARGVCKARRVADVLVVEDEPRMRGLLVQALEGEGHRVEAAADGLAGLILLRSRPFDVAAVDIALPGMSGVELCRHVRREGMTVGVVLVTARDGLEDRIQGLDSGADDYLVKPFALEELAARIRALLRRTAASGGRLEVGDLVLDPMAVRALVGDRVVPLSVKEFGVLRTLASRSGDAVDRRTLLAEVWGDPDRFDPAIVDQYVSYVRKKLAAAESGVRIETLRNVGYRLRRTG